MKKLLLLTLLAPTLAGAVDIRTNDAGALTGTVPNVSLDNSSVTKQGNQFNGANQLLQADGSGLIANADVNGDSVTKKGAMDNGTANINVNQVRVTSTTSVGPACPTGFTRVGLSLCYDSDGVANTLIVSSAVTAGSGLAYATYDTPILNSTNAKLVEVEVHCDVTNDGGAGDSFIAPNARQTGGGGAGPGTGASRKPGICNQSVASTNNYCNEIFSVGVDSAKDMDLAVELVGAASGTCSFYVFKFWE